MTKSLEEALKSAGITRETVRKAVEEKAITLPADTLPRTEIGARASKGSVEPTFSALMRDNGVVRENSAKKVMLASPTESRRKATVAPPGYLPSSSNTAAFARSDHSASMPKVRSSNELSDLQRYMAQLNKVYDTRRFAAPAPAPLNQGPLLEIFGPLILNPMLLADGAWDAAMIEPRHDGIASQLGEPRDEFGEIDMTIGLDFGTSSVKVVIRDSARRAYVIPFFSEAASHPYFLPSRLFESYGLYQLAGGGVSHRDLKLRLLDPIQSDDDFQRAAAFLALVIRRCRGWLFSEKADVYRHARLNWFLNLGLPAESYLNSNFVVRFRALALAAINLANSAGKAVTVDSTRAYCKWAPKAVREEDEPRDDVNPTVSGDMVEVVPEISAQVYGYVKSLRFDEDAANVYMLVDIGAGTVDASIFHVRKEAGDTIGFVMYASNVEQNGVMNLHRERLNWLRKTFAVLAAPNPAALRALEEIERPTDRLDAIPNALGEYFQGVRFNFNTPNEDPDQVFYRDSYRRQVFVNTLLRVRGRKLRDAQLHGLPIFLTGGGSRMEYFNRIVHEINGDQSMSWARLRIDPLEPPRELIAPGLKSSEYDRLSVAFGLSFIRLGKYIRAQDVPDLPTPWTPRRYTAEFISKDQV